MAETLWRQGRTLIIAETLWKRGRTFIMAETLWKHGHTLLWLRHTILETGTHIYYG